MDRMDGAPDGPTRTPFGGGVKDCSVRPSICYGLVRLIILYAGTWWISVVLALATILALATGCCYKSIRVPGAVHEKSDKLSTVVDAVDCGRADAFRIIDRLEESIVEDESVSEPRSVRIRSNHVVLIVQAECLGQGGPREIKSEERPFSEQKTVGLPGAIDVET